MDDSPRNAVMDEKDADAPTVLHAGDPPLHLTGQVSPSPRVHYRMHTFELAPGATRLTVRLHFHKERLCQLFLAVFDPQEYRGTRMNPAGYGDITLELQFGEREAGPGALPGLLRPGRWRVMIDIERTTETAEYVVEVVAEAEPVDVNVLTDDLTGRATSEAKGGSVSMRGAGWYRGELHAHSWNSDGKVPVWQVVEAARAYGLDFLALTDHFTTAGWRDLAGAGGSDLALLHGLELTGHGGHANLHGLHEWVNIYADGPRIEMGGTASCGSPLHFHVELSDLRYPAQFYLLKNGFYHESVAVAPGPSCVVEFTETPTASGYYRIELYADQPQEMRPYRQPSTLLLLSNPIFVRM